MEALGIIIAVLAVAFLASVALIGVVAWLYVGIVIPLLGPATGPATRRPDFPDDRRRRQPAEPRED